MENLIPVGDNGRLANDLGRKTGNGADRVLAGRTFRQYGLRLLRLKHAHGVLVNSQSVVDRNAVQRQLCL